jgi:hypothetical protein
MNRDFKQIEIDRSQTIQLEVTERLDRPLRGFEIIAAIVKHIIPEGDLLGFQQAGGKQIMLSFISTQYAIHYQKIIEECRADLPFTYHEKNISQIITSACIQLPL